MAGNRPGDQELQTAGSAEVVVAHVDPFPILTGHSRCPVDPGCAPSVAPPAVSSPWPLVASCHHNLPCHRRHTYGPSPSP